MAKTPDEMTAKMIDNLPEKTGKTLPQWTKIVSAEKFAKHGEIVKWLKAEHGVTHGYANLIAHHARGNIAVRSSLRWCSRLQKLAWT